MNEFERQIKQKVQGFINQNISMKEQEISIIQQKLQKRRKPVNFLYVSAFSLLSIIIFISIFPLIHPEQNFEFGPAPHSSKNGEEKAIPSIQEDKDVTESPQKVVDEEQEKEQEIEMEKQLETDFLELTSKYNEMQNYEIELDHNDYIIIDKDEYSLAARILGYPTMEEFSSQFSDFATIDSSLKMWGNRLEENENGVYYYYYASKRIPFYADRYYEITKLDDDSYQLIQYHEDMVLDYELMFEFTNFNGEWRISNWNQTINNNTFLNFLEDFNEMNMRKDYHDESELFQFPNNAGYRITNYNTKEEFYSQFLHFMSRDVAEKIWD